MTCADFASDLTARALSVGGTGRGEASALDAHLTSCRVCRDELERIRRVTGAAAEAEALRAAAPPPTALLGKLLASVRNEARGRRDDASRVARAEALAAAAPRSSPACAELREEIPALMLRHLDTAEAARVEMHIAHCAPCEFERSVVGRLLAAQREATRASSRSAVPADGLERLLVSVREERRAEAARAGVAANDAAVAAGPAGPPGPADNCAGPAGPADNCAGGASPRLRIAPGRGRPRWFRLAFSAIAAAAVIAAILLSPNAGGGARVCCDAGLILRPQPSEGASAAPRHVGRDAGAFLFADGDEFETTTEPAMVKLATAAAPRIDDAAADGELLLSLAPATRVARADDHGIELRAGSVSIRAGRLAAPFRITHGDLYATIVGTDLDVDLLPGSEPRLLVLVRSGTVEVGRQGASPLRIGAGRAAIVGAAVLRDAAAEGGTARDTILAPRLTLASRNASIAFGAPLDLDAAFETRIPTPVTIAGVDGNEPRLLLRLRDRGGREREVKVQPAMILDGAADRPSVRVLPDRPTKMRLRFDGLALPAGVWEARLRYHAMTPSTHGTGRAADPSSTLGIEWSGAVESLPVEFEILPQDQR